MRSVVARPVLAVLFGAAGGPIAFLAGERLGAVTLLPPLGQSLLRLSISWAVALVLFSAVVRRVAPERSANYIYIGSGKRKRGKSHTRLLCLLPIPVECAIDSISVVAQPGRFYGGWVSPEVVGPFKGEPGSEGW